VPCPSLPPSGLTLKTFQHTGHIGIDGIHFGNVAGFFDFKSSAYASMPCLAGAAPSLSLGPAGDSELAPLLNSGKGHGSSTPSKKSNTFDGHQKSSKNPRLGNLDYSLYKLTIQGQFHQHFLRAFLRERQISYLFYKDQSHPTFCLKNACNVNDIFFEIKKSETCNFVLFTIGISSKFDEIDPWWQKLAPDVC
jgi:hypothetical protein